MNRLTQKDEQGNWCLKGLAWKQLHVGQVVTQNVWEKLYCALWKLMDYEDTEISPDEVESLNTFDGSQAVRATALLQEEQRKHQWNPVAERLPGEDGDYLVTMVTPGCFKGHPYTNWLCWDSDGREWTDTDGDTIPEQDNVIAWRSIPEPYQPAGRSAKSLFRGGRS